MLQDGTVNHLYDFPFNMNFFKVPEIYFFLIGFAILFYFCHILFFKQVEFLCEIKSPHVPIHGCSWLKAVFHLVLFTGLSLLQCLVKPQPEEERREGLGRRTAAVLYQQSCVMPESRWNLTCTKRRSYSFFFFFFYMYASFLRQTENHCIEALQWGAGACPGLCAAAGFQLRAGCVALVCTGGVGTGLLWNSW